jgi:pyruvate dehydrogenase E1 component
MTSFASLVQDYVRLKGLAAPDLPEGRMVAVVGDAELDEGNIYEALLEGAKHDIRNVWWVIDYNRQSLDSVIAGFQFERFDQLFDAMGWRVVTMKYGSRLEAAFARPGGQALRDWIDECPNDLYSALAYKGGEGWREHLDRDLGSNAAIALILKSHTDPELQALMTNLAGHDMDTVLDAFHAIDDDRPTCFIAYTIKGIGLPFAGHKDNHSGLMNPEQMAAFKQSMAIADGEEWDRFAGLGSDTGKISAFLEQVPFGQRYPRRYEAAKIPVPASLPVPDGERQSTQDGFGRILNELARGDSALAGRIVTTSPDVTVSTNLGAWVNRRGIFDRRERKDVFREEKVVSAQSWVLSQGGQHIELGIAENNLFLLLAALGLSDSLFGARLLPVGTLYDPFIQRGLDALNYACYQGARFMLVATPSGITLAPEGGAHQSIATPLIGIGQDGLAAFEPAHVDELAAIMAWGFDYMQRDGEGSRQGPGWQRDQAGGSIYLRLSTRLLDQPPREITPELRADVIAGGYWLRPPAPGAELAIVYTGAVAAEALEAHAQIIEDIPGAGLLAVTSADRLNAGWLAANRARQAGQADRNSAVERLLAPLAPGAGLVTVIDGHPATLGWLGSVRGQKVVSLGVESFGQTGDLPDLYRVYGIDTDAILDAAAQLCLA